MVLAHEAETKRTTDGVNQDFESEIETFVVPSKRRPPPPIPDGEKEQDSDDANTSILPPVLPKRHSLPILPQRETTVKVGLFFNPTCVYIAIKLQYFVVSL